MNTAERRALGALWSLQGVGPKTVAGIRKQHGPLGALLERPVGEWAPSCRWTPAAQESLGSLRCLADAADALEAKVRALGQAIAFQGDRAFPARLAEIPDAPPLLFHRGPGADAPRRRRLAMVGTRHARTGFLPSAGALAEHLAALGLGVVSGAAEGVDRVCHLGALRAKGETWAFLGSAIEEMEAPQAVLCKPFAEGQGTFFSEYPPGARPAPHTFPRRNRLISGAADAVLVVRAPQKSGALHTADYAEKQGRPLLAMASDPLDPTAVGCHTLISTGRARACLSVSDVLVAVGLEGVSSGPALTLAGPPEGLSAEAEQVFAQVGRGAEDFDAIHQRLPLLPSGQLAAALLELELAGAVVQKAGRRFERVG